MENTLPEVNPTKAHGKSVPPFTRGNLRAMAFHLLSTATQHNDRVAWAKALDLLFQLDATPDPLVPPIEGMDRRLELALMEIEDLKERLEKAVTAGIALATQKADNELARLP